jgi:hypothetical protein
MERLTRFELVPMRWQRIILPTRRQSRNLVRAARLELAYPGWKPSVLAARRRQHTCDHASVVKDHEWHRRPDSNWQGKFWRLARVLRTPAQIGVSDGIRTRVNGVTIRPLMPLEYAHHTIGQFRVLTSTNASDIRRSASPDGAASRNPTGRAVATRDSRSQTTRRQSGAAGAIRTRDFRITNAAFRHLNFSSAQLELMIGLEPTHTTLRGSRAATRTPSAWRR